MSTKISQSPSGNPMQPRRPERANGLRRYEQLLDAAERLLTRSSSEELTIQKLAREAKVPMASVYHFFPGPAAISVALSERYMAGFAELVGKPIPGRAAKSWQEIVSVLVRRAVSFYREHPYAQTLVLGSDHSWAIRQSDLANNRALADPVLALIGDKFAGVSADVLREAIVIGINLGDSVYSLSVAEQGEITPQFGREAAIAICGYLNAKFPNAAD
jgi:AcrR family transcriptional regulator